MCINGDITNERYSFFKQEEQNKEHRVHKYYAEQTTSKVFIRTFVPIGGYVAGGVAVGTVIGGCVLGPPGMAGGAVIGGVGGLVVGVIASSAINYSEYNKWLKKHIETKVFREFEEWHLGHPALQKFIDKDSQHVILDPVRTLDDRIFDRSILKKIKNGYLDPDDESKIISRVENAPEVLAELKAVYSKLINEEINSINSFEIKNGLKALVKDLEFQVENYIDQELTRLQGLRKLKKITLGEFVQRSKELNEKMNLEAERVIRTDPDPLYNGDVLSNNYI